MRKKRTDRRSLVRELERLKTECGRLRAASGAERDGENSADAPVICGRGYPTRALPFRAKSLDEAKRIIISGDR